LQARSSAQSLSKLVYSGLFTWVVARLNESLSGGSNGHNGTAGRSSASSLPGTTGAVIGVLDIFGFEIFDTNSFEQLCINYANEKIQQQFNVNMFHAEEQLYRREGIDYKPSGYRKVGTHCCG
jgi:myosin heavy subunit